MRSDESRTILKYGAFLIVAAILEIPASGFGPLIVTIAAIATSLALVRRLKW